MKTIYKYPLQPVGMQLVPMPRDAEILSAQIQGGRICLWAMVEDGDAPEDRMILISGTGHPADARLRKSDFIGTVQDGPFVWHVFEGRP